MKRLFEYLKGRKELFTTYELDKLSTVTDILREHKINYYVFSKYTGSSNRRTGEWHSIFENRELETQYYVYVSKEVFSKAQYLIKQYYKSN